MNEKGAISLLFEQNFGDGPLFKNQIELVYQLLDTKESNYYTAKKNSEEYSKALSRLKAYISQLLSESARRSVTKEFNQSLKIVIEKRINKNEFDVDEISNNIIDALFEKNRKKTHENRVTNAENSMMLDLYDSLLEADYISIITAREIRFDFDILDNKFSLVNILLVQLIEAVVGNEKPKKYRFNFPLEQMCYLFWRGLRKQIHAILIEDKTKFSSFINFTKIEQLKTAMVKKTGAFDHSSDAELAITNQILKHLSDNYTIAVFHLNAPVYSIPIIAVNPNDRNSSKTYFLLQSTSEAEEVHKLSQGELIYWKLFVWDNLKSNSTGKQIHYSPTY